MPFRPYAVLEDFLKIYIYGHSLTNFQGYNFPVIISEYMENSSLDTFFKENKTTLNPKKLTSKQKYLILLGIALGMKIIHEQSIIHRDLKPGNILLDSNYYPYICDFGISFISDISASQNTSLIFARAKISKTISINTYLRKNLPLVRLS